MRDHREPTPTDETPAGWYPRVGRRPAGRRTTLLRLVTAGAAVATLLGAAGVVMKAPDRAPGLAAAPAPDSPSTPDPNLPAPQVDMSISRLSEDAGRTVNLTVDDGPDPQWTPRILDVLARNGAKAVFCMLGPNARAHPELARQVAAAGHRLCDHSVSHDTAMDHKEVAYQQQEIVDGLRMIQESTGGAPVPYYRAPGGAFTPESRQVAAAHGMRPLGWNVDTRDFERPGVEKIVETAKDQLRRGPTVLLHDGGGNRAQTLEALEQLLPWLRANGYTFSFPRR
ncbi:polysaccharide deacetylase family protein [Kitasatospora sp. NPDC094028]